MLISLRLPEWLLQRIDEKAAASQRSRNSVINRSLKEIFNAAEDSTWPGSPEQKEFEKISTPVGKPIHVQLPERWIVEKKEMHDYKNCRIYKCGMCAMRKTWIVETS